MPENGRMATVRRKLAQVLESSNERLRISAEMKQTAIEPVRRSETAVQQSQDRLLPTARVEGDMLGSEPPAPPRKLERTTDLLERTTDLLERTTDLLERTTDLLERVEDRDFKNEVVRLDGRHFVDCTMSDCILVYSGQPLLLETTHFSGCRFRFEAEAALTMQLYKLFGEVADEAVQVRGVKPSGKTACSRPN